MEYVNGQVAALEAAVLSLIAANPKADAVRALLGTIRDQTEAKLELSELPDYAEGLRRTMDMLLVDVDSEPSPT